MAVWTSDYAPLKSSAVWLENAAGLRYSLRFGFGLMNAAKFVAAAANWTSVADKSVCSVPLSTR